MARLELALALCMAVACGGSDTPVPKKVSELEPVVKPRVKPERDGPFHNPNVDPPGPRTQTQIPSADLARTIERGKAQAGEGRTTVAIQTLRKCANRIPQSVECEAELALTMFAADQHVAHARYFLAEASRADPAQAEDALYRRMGTMALDKAQFSTARSAYGVLVARETATADDLEQYAYALQSEAGYTDEAADAYARAYALDGTRHELLRKRATLLAQAGDHARAADLFEAYVEKGSPDPKVKTALQERVISLREEALAQAKAQPPRRTRRTRRTRSPPQTTRAERGSRSQQACAGGPVVDAGSVQ